MDLGKVVRELEVEPLSWPGSLPQRQPVPAEPVTVPVEEEVPA